MFEDGCQFLSQHAYGMKEHHATRHHFDLRLEWNGALLSWALPKGPSLIAGVAREAVEMEDHRKVNLLFEGVHRTGPILTWDRGLWAPHPGYPDVLGSLRRGVLRFTIYGEKLKGSWILTRISTGSSGQKPVWTLCKEADAFSRQPTDRCILDESPGSILTGKNLQQVSDDWHHSKRKVGQTFLF